jgi:ribokinase
MQEILTIGSSLIDTFIQSPHFAVERGSDGVKLCQLYGEKLEVSSFEVRTGGGGSNTAVGFARAGFTVASITETGRDVFAQVLLDDFHKEFVSTRHVVQEKKEQTGGSVILVGPDGGRTVMVHRGASSQLDPHDIPLQALKDCTWLHLSSISGRLETLQTIGDAMHTSRGFLSWNPGRGELELLQTGRLRIEDMACKILFLNKSEWESIKRLHESILTTIGEVVVTDGSSAGSVFLGPSTSDAIEFVPPQTETVDETGAGDAFAVGYVTARLHVKEPEEAVGWGLHNAQSVIQYFGAKQGLLTQAQMAHL